MGRFTTLIIPTVAVLALSGLGAVNRDDGAAQMAKLIQAAAGTWSITVNDEPRAGGARPEPYNGQEVWSAPGGGPVMEQFHATSAEGEQDDTALFWWDSQTNKIRGLWCAPINDEGCNGFEAKWDGNRFVNDGDWIYHGKRISWQEVFAFETPNSFVQTLSMGEPGGAMKLATTIRGRKMDSDKKP